MIQNLKTNLIITQLAQGGVATESGSKETKGMIKRNSVIIAKKYGHFANKCWKKNEDDNN